MKKICLLLALAASGFTAFGQKALKPVENAHKMYAIDPAAKVQTVRKDMLSEGNKSAPTAPSTTLSSIVGSDWADQVGYTYFDLQTYGSHSTGLQYYPATGDISVVWHFGRGIRRASRTAGYNHYNAALNRWLWTGGITNPGSQDDSCNLAASPLKPACTAITYGGSLLAARIGWPSLIWNGTKEAIASYAVYPNDASGLTRIHTLQPSVGAFGAQFGPPPVAAFDTVRGDYTKEAVFHLTASADANSYLLTASADIDNNPNLLAGGTVNNIILYHSNDVGTSWTSNTIPFISAAYGIGGIKGTGYSIDAKGDAVAVVVQCMTAAPDNGIATYLFKSTFKGQPGTWSSRLISKRTTADTVYASSGFVLSTDGSYSVLLDNNGKAHVTSHAGYGTLDSAGGSTGNFYMNGAFTSGLSGALYYWNEDMPDNSGFRTISRVVDINRDGVRDVPAYTAANGAGPYPQAGVSMSNLSVDASNNVYITYSAVVEGTQSTSNPNVTRDLYVIASYNGGNTWTNAINVAGRLVINNCFTADDGSSGSGLYEEAYPIVGKRIGADDKIHVQFMSDDLAGLARGGTNSIAAINGWTNWRGNLMSYKGVSTKDIEGSYLKASFPEQICSGATLPIAVASPVNRLCIYGPLDATSIFRAELDTTGLSAFTNPVLLGTFTGNTNGGTINAVFPSNWQGNGHIRIVVKNGNAAANPQLFESSTGEFAITVTIGTPAAPANLTNRTSSGAVVTSNGTICGVNSVLFQVDAVSNANLYEWSITPTSAGSIQMNGDRIIGGTASLAAFNNAYSGPVTIGVKAINGCGSSTNNTFSFTVGGGTVTASGVTATTSIGGGQWQFSAGITGPYTNLSPSVTQTTIDVLTQGSGAGYYRYTNGTCPTNVVFFSEATSLTSSQLAQSVNIYPNPARESFQVTANSLDGAAIVTVFNGVGQVVKTASLDLTGGGTGGTTFSTDGMSKGIYFVRIATGGASTVKRVVIQ